jgi:hypothetical protein
MEGLAVEDERQLKAIGVFCSKPGSEQGGKRKDGAHALDWIYLVRQIAYFDTGKTCDDAAAKQVATVLRKQKNFPNDSEWNQRVSAPGAQEAMLKMIRDELAVAVVKEPGAKESRSIDQIARR